MSYLGNAPARSFISFERQVFTIVNSQTAYALSHSVTNENDIRLVINNVVQEPGSGKAYTATGTALTLSAALTNGTDEMYCVFLGRATATSAPGAGSIGTAQLANDSVTLAKMASGTDGNIISYDASGNPVAVATGNDGQVLTSAGAGAQPAFETLPVGGITGADEWRVTANFSGDAAPITSNWERNDVHSSYIGSGMTQSSGLFTFPETGLWLIQALATFSNNTASSHYCGLYIRTTINNGGAFSGIASSTQGIYRGDSNNYYANAFCSALFDVTNVTNCKASLQVDHQQNDTINYGSTNSQLTGMNFIRLGDT